MRVIVAGSRSVEDVCIVSRAIRESGFPVTVIISGTARGVDRLGEEWAKRNMIPVRRFPADWDRYKSYAGYVRNGEMARNADALVAIWDGRSRGTKNMIDIAMSRGMLVYVHQTGVEKTMKDVTIYTDGACWPNPGGPGGFGAITIQGKTRTELSMGFRSTTVNRMELMAPIVALSALTEQSHATVFSDSQYVVNSVSKGWVYKWQENRWKGADGLPAKNLDLWQILLPYLEFHDVTFAWVRGHTGIPENERCDILAGEAKRSPTFDDGGFLALQ